ncbi:MAG: VanW family protein [Clostridia bacterium]|nr:VanW family protein [Clostridia bacterium]
MTKFIFKKLKLLVFMLALSAGVFCLCGFVFEARVPKGVTVDGVAVGGMAKSAAAEIIRAETVKFLKEKSLKITAGENVYEFTYPEINFKDDVYAILSNAEKGRSYTSQKSFYLCALNEVAAGICQSESVSAVEPYADFKAYGEPFIYNAGTDGRIADKTKLAEDIKASLCGNFESVTVKFKPVYRKTSLETVKKNTRKIGGFTTYFDGGNLNRTSNIRLAAAMLNGTVLQAGETLSFNDIVGVRTKERGFLPAKIIENGEFTEGVGGGVCQVSTTLYNAAVLSGMKVVEYHPHSLAVGYVPPSRDAMVSGKAFDLKIKNPAKTPVYIRATTLNGSVNFTFYGADDGAEYSIKSAVTGSIPAPEEITEERDRARDGRDGITSEGYLEITRGGYTKRTLLRKDKYLPVKKIIYGGADENFENGESVENAEGAEDGADENIG